MRSFWTGEKVCYVNFGPSEIWSWRPWSEFVVRSTVQELSGPVRGQNFLLDQRSMIPFMEYLNPGLNFWKKTFKILAILRYIFSENRKDNIFSKYLIAKSKGYFFADISSQKISFHFARRYFQKYSIFSTSEKIFLKYIIANEKIFAEKIF